MRQSSATHAPHDSPTARNRQMRGTVLERVTYDMHLSALMWRSPFVPSLSKCFNKPRLQTLNFAASSCWKTTAHRQS
jgi:hypothetical protein